MENTKGRDSNSIDPNQEHGNPSEEEIRISAYYRYLERGGRPGDPVTDWLEAEVEILRSKSK